MSRIHEALRKAGQGTDRTPDRLPPTPVRPEDAVASGSAPAATVISPASEVDPAPQTSPAALAEPEPWENILQNARLLPYAPDASALLVDPQRPGHPPAEEFRSLRTRLNHLQGTQQLRTLVVTSASPAEGKSFTAINLALTQAQLSDKRVLLADFDLRRPTVESAFRPLDSPLDDMNRAPGITDYLEGKAALADIVQRVEGTNLYVLTAGRPVSNPLELLNLKQCRSLIQQLHEQFDWTILDTPPLLFAADGNLLSTLCDGTILVVRIGATTVDAVSRSLQSLCQDNILGIVVNGARQGELYSNYSYYYSDESSRAAKQEN